MQAVALVTGQQVGWKISPEAIEIRDRLQTWWLRADDRNKVDTTLSLLVAHGGLPPASVRLIKDVRKWVESELLRQKLPRLQTLAWAKDQVMRRATESGLELDIDAEVAALTNKVLAEYRKAVVDADELVFGEIGVAETRCWLACSRYLIKLDGKRLARSATRYAQELQVVQLFNKCRRYGVEGPLALEDLANKKLRGWQGNPHELTQDHTGQWRWGDGVPATREAAEAYRSVLRDDGYGYGPRPTTETIPSERFVRRGEGYADLFRDMDLFKIMQEIDRAEAAQRKAKSDQQSDSNSADPKNT